MMILMMMVMMMMLMLRDYVSRSALTMEVGIESELSQYQSKVKAQQVLGPIPESRSTSMHSSSLISPAVHRC